MEKGEQLRLLPVREGGGEGNGRKREWTHILLTILLRASGWSWLRQSPPAAAAAALGSTPPAAATAAGSAPCVGRQLAAPSMAWDPVAASLCLKFECWTDRIEDSTGCCLSLPRSDNRRRNRGFHPACVRRN
jgi:hypothetical protein